MMSRKRLECIPHFEEDIQACSCPCKTPYEAEDFHAEDEG